MWGFGICEVSHDPDVTIGKTIDEFLDIVSVNSSIVYFHNMKFDIQFILYTLFKLGYVHTTEQFHLPKGAMKSLISNMGQFYSVTVHFMNGKKVEFRDSYKKINLPVSVIAKSFGFDCLKGEIDYHTPRPVGHVITDVERAYIENDVKIVAMALALEFDSGMTRLTVGSDSLAEFKNTIGDKLFKRIFPVFPFHMDAEIRRAYRGGFTYADPRFTGCVVRGGLVFDVNSLYPSVMYNEAMPYSHPEFVRGEVLPTDSHPLTIFSVTFTAKLKKNHIPCIQVKGSSRFVATEYLTNINEPTNLMVTNVDWELYNKHYDIDVIEYGGGWRFKAISGVFDSYIDKWSEIKQTSVGGMREIAKLHLNSLYGKFASNPTVASKSPDFNGEVVTYHREPEEQREPVYTAVAVFITSYARALTINAAQENYDVFAYADTDSLHLLTYETPKTLDVHPTRMGAWKHEYTFDSAFYVRPKAYFERLFTFDGSTKYHNAVAGLPRDITAKLTFDDVYHGNMIDGKLSPKTFPGGVVLMPVPYELKLW